MRNSPIIVTSLIGAINNAQNVMHIAVIFTVMMAITESINIEIKISSVSHNFKEEIEKQL